MVGIQKRGTITKSPIMTPVGAFAYCCPLRAERLKKPNDTAVPRE
jgi:hypothetical protein